MVGSLVIVLLQILSWFWQWNTFENRLIFGEVKAYKKTVPFLGHLVGVARAGQWVQFLPSPLAPEVEYRANGSVCGWTFYCYTHIMCQNACHFQTKQLIHLMGRGVLTWQPFQLPSLPIISPSTRPDSSKTLALHKSYICLLTYLFKLLSRPHPILVD